jgi:predicted amidophosphoribosyltransferase
MATIPCPHCGRQIAEQSKLCMYCAKPLAADGVDAAEKRAKMLQAMYSAGVGLPPKKRASMIERLADESLPVRLLAAVPLLAVGLIWPPWAWRSMKTLFRP